MKYLLSLLLMMVVTISANAQDASFYQKYAEKGDKEAMYNLAQCYINGNGGVAQDYNLATTWLTKAVKKNYAPAQKDLGLCYLYGVGVLKDYQQAWTLLNKAHKQKNASATYYISQMYKSGIHVSADKAMYLKFLKEAAGNGDDDAMLELGLLYLHGSEDYNIDQNATLGVESIQAAAKQNNAEAILELGFAYREGMGGLKEDLQKSTELITQAAQLGNTRALSEAGMIYLNGYGAERDFSQAY